MPSSNLMPKEIINIFKLDPHTPRNVFSLNGTWQLAPGNESAIPRSFPHTVPVPALVDLATPSYPWGSSKYHYYRTSIRLENWQNQSVFLKIGQAQYGTTVWINGKRAGESISCYTSQEYRIDSLLEDRDQNEIIIRVGNKETLPPESAVGRDQEKTTFIPGIWGDVVLTACRSIRIKLVQIIPHIDTADAEVRLTLENLSKVSQKGRIELKILERVSRRDASKTTTLPFSVGPQQVVLLTSRVPVNELKLWHPNNPFLYELESILTNGEHPIDQMRTTFGMREFTIRGKGFYLNGERIFLRGSNIAFHRFLSDNERGLLPWNRDWIKRVLIDIPKSHHFNFFRNHLGQMYSAWYDIADERGMLIQNEWQFWMTTGSKEQIASEFREWLEDNWNHPSIVIWDALNESSDETIQKEIVPLMKTLDPTRPWESVDFVEDHPYIYSLGPVLNDRRFGFTRSLEEIEQSPTPAVVNEFLWWWIDKHGRPTSLMKGVVERWLGPDFSVEELHAHQSFLAQELVELFRRIRADAIQPFVYLSNADGPTSHWFTGPIAGLTPKPILATLKNAFAPFGISIELWDRHFLPNETRALTLCVFNDEPSPQSGVIQFGITESSQRWLTKESKSVRVNASGTAHIPITVTFPGSEGSYTVRAELKRSDGSVSAWSGKIAHVVSEFEIPEVVKQSGIAILETTGELKSFLAQRGISCRDFSAGATNGLHAVVIAHGEVHGEFYQQSTAALSHFAETGGTLVILEPEYSIRQTADVSILPGVILSIRNRNDTDKGGYDSYLFPTDHSHPLWKGIRRDYLKIFNGAFGGEAISEHDVRCSVPANALARCGLGLGIDAIFEITYGMGKILVSRLQLRDRLFNHAGSSSLYARREDPVLQRYFINLLSYACTSALASGVHRMKIKQ